MSKCQKSMQQLTEIIDIATTGLGKPSKANNFLLRCGVIALVIASMLACSEKRKNFIETAPGIDDKLNSSRILKRGLPGDPRTLDPHLADDTFSFPVLRDLYEGLTSEDRDGKIVPGVAKSWAVDKTGTVYTFLIRPNARWSDGDPITASEFVQGLRRAVDPQTASGSSALLTVIKGASDIIAGRKKNAELGVTALDKYSVRIELEHPAPFLLQILSEPIGAPLHLHANTGAHIFKADNLKVSNGPYALVKRIPGSFIELSRNPNYWDASNVLIDRVRYITVESEATEIREYVAEQVDMTSTIPSPDLDRIRQKYGSEIQTAPILGTLYLALDVSEPPLRDKSDLRQALSMALDRDLIAEHVTLGVTPAYSFVADGISGYTAPTYPWSKWPRERQLSYAGNLYARAGYSKLKPLRLTLYFNSGESIQRIMVAIAASWKKNLGVISDLVSEEFRVFLAGRKDRSRWDVARLGWYADYDDPASFLEVFSKNNSQNDPGYVNPAFNELIDAARIEPNSERRILLLQHSEELMLNDYPIIPVYFYTARRLVKPYIGGATISPLNHTNSKHLYWKNAL